MLKKGPVTRICMCCGEKKEIDVDATYCKECSTPSFGFGVIEAPSEPAKSQGLYNIRSL